MRKPNKTKAYRTFCCSGFMHREIWIDLKVTRQVVDISFDEILMINLKTVFVLPFIAFSQVENPFFIRITC